MLADNWTALTISSECRLYLLSRFFVATRPIQDCMCRAFPFQRLSLEPF